MQLEFTKYSCASTSKKRNDNTKYSLRNVQEGKYKKWYKILILD